MSRVRRFIFNSDFMTIAHRGSVTVTFTIPALELGDLFLRVGVVDIDTIVPPGSLVRMRARYTGTNSTNTIATDGSITITENKGSGKKIEYFVNMNFGKDKLYADYLIAGTGFSSSESHTLSTAQTITLYIDYLYQPNT
jgi:hypothetical protein